MDDRYGEENAGRCGKENVLPSKSLSDRTNWPEGSGKSFSGMKDFSPFASEFSSRIVHSGMVINVQRCGQRSQSDIEGLSLRFGGAKRSCFSLSGERAPLDRLPDANHVNANVMVEKQAFRDVAAGAKKFKEAAASLASDSSGPNPKSSAGNFVKLNINGRGRRNRKFVNRSSRITGRKKTSFKRKRSGSEVDGRKDEMIWEDDGWCEPGTATPLEREVDACSSEDAVAALKDPTEENLRKVLRSVFGYGSFRKGQFETVRRVLSGESTMLVQSTGSGKSLCYQLAAYLLPGITLVISPLLALMADQMLHLPAALPGALLNSTQSAKESMEVLEQLRSSSVKVLFISPERLSSESFLTVISSLPSISLVVVDEAHCVSEWSHNFRPSYYRLGRILRDKVKPKCLLAMTATATRETMKSVLSSLDISMSNVLSEPEVPNNLALTVSRCEDKKLQAIAQLLQSTPYLEAQSIIVYVKFQNEADVVCNYLQSKGLLADSYHGGKTGQARREVQKRFSQNKLRVIVATVAFGMGLDKCDVRAVIHYCIPASLEHYVQEIGRAGRDGEPAFCHLFLDKCSYLKLRSLAHSDGADQYAINKLLSCIFGRGDGLQSLSIEPTCIELDLKEEVIATILSYLEVRKERHLTVLSPLKTTCVVHFHKCSPHLLAKSSAFVAAILESKRDRNGGYVFSLPSLAAEMKVTLMEIQKDLQLLQSRGEIAYELKDPAFCFHVLKVPEDICVLTAEVAEYLSQAEACKVRKLDFMYMAAALSVGPSTEPVRESIKSYFDSTSEQLAPAKPEILKTTSSFLRADIKVFLRSHETDFTGRAIARIFHGLPSPQYPASFWSKNHFWGRHMDVDFYAIREVATAELIACRRSKR